MRKIEYHTAEAFTEHPFHGAQIAVFLEAGELNEVQMQRLAAETNLSETVFVTGRNEDRFSLRVFSPLQEVEFAGHPIIATGHVLAELGEIELGKSPKRVDFVGQSGEVEVQVDGAPMKPNLIQFALSVDTKIDRMTPSNQEIADSLGIELGDIRADGVHSLLVTREQTYLIVPVNSMSAVRKSVFNLKAWSYSSATSLMISQVLLFSEETEEAQHDFHGRLLGPNIGVHEDPPIGVSIPAFAAYLDHWPEFRSVSSRFKIERGTLDTRQSVLSVERLERSGQGLRILVGGPAISISHGSMLVPEVDLVRG